MTTTRLHSSLNALAGPLALLLAAALVVAALAMLTPEPSLP